MSACVFVCVVLCRDHAFLMHSGALRLRESVVYKVKKKNARRGHLADSARPCVGGGF